jgi:alkylation response protein AidB-like acyl-CoA dehydrogenase
MDFALTDDQRAIFEALSYGPWSSVSPPTPAIRSPTTACSCMAATATCRTIRWERIVRDLRVHQILEGTNEIMRVIIAREMFR